jgi:hypothetical protein
VKTHQKKNNSKDIKSPRLTNSNKRLNHLGLLSNHSYKDIFRCGIFNFLNILSHANILRTEILVVCFDGISQCCTTYIQTNKIERIKKAAGNTNSAG